MITRRTLLGTGVAAVVLAPLARGGDALRAAMAESPLIYLTPLKTERCGEPLPGGDLVRAARRFHVPGNAFGRLANRGDSPWPEPRQNLGR